MALTDRLKFGRPVVKGSLENIERNFESQHGQSNVYTRLIQSLDKVDMKIIYKCQNVGSFDRQEFPNISGESALEILEEKAQSYDRECHKILDVPFHLEHRRKKNGKSDFIKLSYSKTVKNETGRGPENFERTFQVEIKYEE